MTDAEPVQFAEEAFFEPGIEESPPNYYREASWRFLDAMKRAFMFTRAYKGSKRFAEDCVLAALGLWDIVGCKNQPDIARKHRVTKAHVSDTIKQFQALMDIQPMPGQRTAQSCRKFSEVRKSQLSTK